MTESESQRDRHETRGAAAPANDVVAYGHGVVPVAYHLFFLAEANTDPTPSISTANGLVDIQPGMVIIFTGIHTGDARLTVEARNGPPTEVSAEAWDEIVEVSFDASIGRMAVSALGDDVTDPFPILTHVGAGSYRARVHARGRDTDIDGTVFEPVEDYLIQIWPAPPAPQRIYKQTDRYGAELRSTDQDETPALQPPPPTLEDQRAEALRQNLLRAREQHRQSS